MTKTMFRKELSKLMVFVRKYNETRRATISLIGGDILSNEHSGLLYDMISFCIKQFAKTAEDNNQIIYSYIFGRLQYETYMFDGRQYGACKSPQALYATIQLVNQFKQVESRNLEHPHF